MKIAAVKPDAAPHADSIPLCRCSVFPRSQQIPSHRRTSADPMPWRWLFGFSDMGASDGHDHDSGAPQLVHQTCLAVAAEDEAVQVQHGIV
jgi:hypothetical protein